MLVLNWARTGSQNFVSCCQNVALLVPLHWWWWWRWWWLLSTDDDEIFIKFPPHANQLAQDHPLRSRWSEGDKKITGSTKKLLCIQVCFLGGLGIAQWAWNDWPSDGFTADWIIQIHRGLLTTCCFTTFVQLLLSRFVCIQAVWPTQKTSMSWPKKKRHGTPPTKKSRICQLTNCPNCTRAQSCKRGSQVSLQWIPSCVGGVRLVWNRCWAEEEGEGAFSLQPVYVLAAASALLPNTPEPHLTNLPTVYQSADQGIQKHFHVRSILVSMVGGLWPPLGERGLMFNF